MYCPNCGFELDSNDTYCPNCSAMVDRGRSAYVPEDPEDPAPFEDFEEEPTETTATRHTSNHGVAMFISMILPGIGAVIAGNGKGLAIFALSIVAAITAYSSIVLMPFSISVMLVLWIIGLSMTMEATTVSEDAIPC